MTFGSLVPKATVVCLASVLASCAQSSPPSADFGRVALPGVDLVPIALAVNTDVNIYKEFCNLNNDMLRIYIGNMGRENSPPTAFRVTFAVPGGEARFTVKLNEVRAGTVFHFALAVPRGCYKPDCSFRILADANNEVAESNEANNLAFGLCEK